MRIQLSVSISTLGSWRACYQRLACSNDDFTLTTPRVIANKWKGIHLLDTQADKHECSKCREKT